MIMREFITSQFSYCPLAWMCHSRAVSINFMNGLVYDRQSTFDEPLDKDKSFSIHHRNLEVLATEMYKVYSNIVSDIMNDIFEKSEISYNIWNNCNFFPRNIKSVYHVSETISYLGPKIWDLVPENIKDLENNISFKAKIKFWKPESCPCRLCIVYLSQIGFIGSKSRFNTFERLIILCFFCVKRTSNQNMSDVFKGNVS